MGTLTSSIPKAWVIGLGLIGGSIALALKESGYIVSGTDLDKEREQAAIQLNLIDRAEPDFEADIIFIATLASGVVSTFNSISDKIRSDALVTDVASVKNKIAEQILDPRFIGGHPMAGSEKIGPDNAISSMFVGAYWVLTPQEFTPMDIYSELTKTIRSVFKAEPIALSPKEHDNFVALVSHVPYLTAVSLMNLASKGSKQEQPLLKLAAGGFRDMTRIASGSPNIWPDICLQNSDEISNVLGDLIAYLDHLKIQIENKNKDLILEELRSAQSGREGLLKSRLKPSALAEIRIQVEDRPGELLNILAVAKSLNVNIEDLQLSHGLTEDGSIKTAGTLRLIVDLKDGEKLADFLSERNYITVLESEAIL
jgi:prephenate dehydrogenase